MNCIEVTGLLEMFLNWIGKLLLEWLPPCATPMLLLLSPEPLLTCAICCLCVFQSGYSEVYPVSACAAVCSSEGASLSPQ